MAENQEEEELAVARNAGPLVKLDDLCKYFPLKGLVRTNHWVRAVDGVDLDIAKGETFALVGESGCGKSTLAKVCVGLYEPTRGSVYFQGVDVAGFGGRERKTLRQNIQMVFQNPFNSLDPRMTIERIVGEPISVHGFSKGEEQRAEIARLLEQVGLKPEHLHRYPYQFSGGQRQRIAIARALATRPRFLILDEPTSSLDVSVQAQILNLLSDLRDRLGLTYLLISHDLSIVRHISDRIGVMYLGKIVEIGSNEQIFSNALHPYTQALLDSVPRLDFGTKRKRVKLRGDVPSAVNLPSGCSFHPRCPFAFERCRIEEPSLLEAEPGHLVSCHLYPTRTPS